ncbi:MAG: bifunctional nuclease family protein [Muribaculaceae bacterium]|nr:bifunctional nuclease family protein [Muribaculaceae bacterium]MBQ3961821.1 bifunctional nuclease family protein [Muribaculaceae bacterium]MBQ5465823.1 bifunctional nuclease family protein [Muribaculaceae bacterium]
MEQNDKIELQVWGITYNPVQSGAYALLLRQVDGEYRIPIVVGVAEAQSIAMRLENVIPPRPMSHDLMVSMLHAFGISIDEVLIYEFNEGVFMSQIQLNDGEKQVSLDSRTSDAIALALRTNARIFTTPEVMKQTGILIEKNEKGDPVIRKEPRTLADYSLTELQSLLDEAVDREEYERAAEIQRMMQTKTGN